MNFHISPRWPPLRPQLSSSSLRSPSPQHHDPTGTVHDTVTSHHSSRPSHPATSPSSVTIEVDTVDTSDDDSATNLKTHQQRNNLGSSGSDSRHDDVDTASESDISVDDVTQDSRDVLVQRLTDLADKLSEGNIRTASIEALHKQVDEMERVLRGGSRARSASRHSRISPSRRAQSLRPGSRPRSLQFANSGATGRGANRGELSPGRDALGILSATPMSPSWFVSHIQRQPSMPFQDKNREGVGGPTASQQADVSSLSYPKLNNDLEEQSRQEGVYPQTLQQQQCDAAPQQIEQPSQQRNNDVRSTTAAVSTSTQPEISAEVAEVVHEAEKMCAEMATIIQSLQSRRQESDVIPSLLILYLTLQPLACDVSSIYPLFSFFVAYDHLAGI